MLVVARKMGEKIVIPLTLDVLEKLHDRIERGEDVRIEISPLKLTSEGVRIGVEAPREVLVLREELLE